MYILTSYLFTTVTLIQTAFASWAEVCDDAENNRWAFAFFAVVFVVEHIGFIVAAVYKRAYELEKLMMTREEVHQDVESHKPSLYKHRFVRSVSVPPAKRV